MKTVNEERYDEINSGGKLKWEKRRENRKNSE